MDRAGAETMLMNLYRQVDRTRVQFDFITFTNETADYDTEILQLGGKIIPIIANNPIERMLRLRKFLKKNPDYKIIHAHMLLSNAFHLLAAKAAGVEHRISHAHNTNNGKSNIVKKAYEKWALITNRKIATHKIACGKLAAQYLFGTTDNVWLLPNAVDIEQMIVVANDSRDYIDQKFANKGLKIIQVGRLSEVKNHQFSLKVAEELNNRDIDFTLYIVGQGPLENTLRQQVEDKSLLDNVKFLGIRTDITELMASANFMVMPSLHEGFPVVLVESQAVGLMSIVSEQVSFEVDLSLGLIEFSPINSIDKWVGSLSESQNSKPTKQQTIDSLRKHGFDAVTNAEKLTQFYIDL
ncbi:glycosyltransferase [uncultured Psychrobacter sp.]|uniref:glycosyltransferase n=1 Tax=uncultured Psychrobacter sp. TaxID=259303 RepID=UPI0026254D76|nr:glycosyltransferase [uncultured Psychrobacter sp.]